jgi:hypothetical protein
MIRIPFFLLLFVCSSSMLFARNIDVVLIGLTQGSSPAFEETLDRRIRENLSTSGDLSITDYVQTQSFRRKIRFDEFPTVSRKLVESLKQYTTDSTVFVWGRIKNCTITGARKKLIRGFIRGEFTITLNIYSLRFKNYAFAGDIQASVEKDNGFIFFGDADKEIIVSATDRSELMDRLLDQAARKSASLITTVVQSERLLAAKEADAAGVQSYEVPSVSDMFNMPSVEAASVNKNRKRTASATESPALPKQTQFPAADSTLSKKQPAVSPTIKPDPAPSASKPGPPIDTVKAKSQK